MYRQNTEKILLFFIKSGLYLALLTPFIAWDQVIYPFIFPKVIFFRVLVEILLVLFLALWISNEDYAPKITSLGLMILLYMGIVAFTSAIGENPYRSFFSTILRGEGALTHLHLAAFFFILSTVIKTQKEWLSILLFASLVFFFENALAFGQIWKFPFLKMFGVNRPNGTFGNPAFYASFTLFGLWLGVYLISALKKNKGALARALAGINILSIFFGLSALYKTENRGSTLALFAAGVFLLILFILPKYQTLKRFITKKTFIVLGIAVIAFGVLIKYDYTVRELVYYRFNDSTIKNRLITWNIGWKGFLDKPFLGYGNENYYRVFEKYFQPAIIRDRGSYPWYDRAHNAFIDILIANGIAGIFAYLGIFFAAFYAIVRSNIPKFQKLTLAGIFLSYAIQNFFLFDTVSTLVFFYFFLGYVNFFLGARSGRFIEKIRRAIQNFFYRPSHIWIKLTPVFILFFSAMYFWNIKPLQAAYFASRFALVNDMPTSEVQKNFEKAFFLSSPRNHEFRQSLGNYLNLRLQRGDEISTYETLIPLALKELQKSVEKDPWNLQTRYILTELARLVSPANKDLLGLAEYHSLEIIKRSPLRYQGYFALAKVREAQGRNEEGRALFREVLKFQPNFLPAYFNIAIFLILDGRYNEAYNVLDEINSRRDFFIYEKANIERIAGAFIEKKEYQKAINLYSEAINNMDEALEKDYSFAVSLYAQFGDYYSKLISLEERYGSKDKAERLKKKSAQLEKDFNSTWGGKKLPGT